MSSLQMIAMALAFFLFVPPVFTLALDPSMTFDFILTVDGGISASGAVGDEIVVQLELKRTDEDDSYFMHSMQDQIIYDGRYFSLIQDSVEVADDYDFFVYNMEDGIRKRITLSRVVWNPNGAETPASLIVATFRLRALASVEEMEILNRNYRMVTRAGDTYMAAGNDVKVSISGLSPNHHELSFISGEAFNALPEGYRLLVLETDRELEGFAYKIGGQALFYSPLYSDPSSGSHVYLYAVDGGLTREDALESLQVEAGACPALNYSRDVNLDGRVDSTDAVLTYGLYKGLHQIDPEFSKVSMRMRLEADVNGDQVVDISDSMGILHYCWGH